MNSRPISSDLLYFEALCVARCGSEMERSKDPWNFSSCSALPALRRDGAALGDWGCTCNYLSTRSLSFLSPFCLSRAGTLRVMMCDIGHRRLVVVKGTARHIGTLLAKVVLRGPMFVLSSHKAVSHLQFRSLCTAGSCCLLYTSPSPRDQRGTRMPSSA